MIEHSRVEDNMPTHLLCEVFGFPVTDDSLEAIRHRREKLCPYNNRVPRCTKVSVSDPLGVCSILVNHAPIIICPVRFRQEWKIIRDAQTFLLPAATLTNYVTEAMLKDVGEEEVGSIDAVLVEHTPQGMVTDFGVLEIQAVYISGNIRNPFRVYVGESAVWDRKHEPRPDWLSSVKRLVRQLTVKGVIFERWGKKMAIAVQRQFFDEHMPQMRNVEALSAGQADVAWLLYDLILNPQTGRYEIELERTIYMSFESMFERFSKIEAGSMDDFMATLQKKLREKLGIGSSGQQRAGKKR